MVLLGGLLMLIGIGALLFLQFANDIPSIRDNPAWINLQNTVFCTTGETYTEALGAQSFSGTRSLGRSFSAYCERDGERREVTPQAFLVRAGVFVVPFVGGLCLVIVAPMLFMGSIVRGGLRMATSNSGGVGGVQVVRMSDLQAGKSRSLTQKLQELEEAYQRGQLSESEYQRARQRLLDGFEEET
jgi:hypothetical protein